MKSDAKRYSILLKRTIQIEALLFEHTTFKISIGGSFSVWGKKRILSKM